MKFFGIYSFGFALHTIKFSKQDLFILLTKLFKYMQKYFNMFNFMLILHSFFQIYVLIYLTRF